MNMASRSGSYGTKYGFLLKVAECCLALGIVFCGPFRGYLGQESL